MPDAIEPFDALYQRSPDPWGTTTRWYERRKRALLLAALPRDRYGAAYEAGCGTGHISVELAERCDTLLASDASPVALRVATEALAKHPNATTVLHRLPDDWPAGAFDLIVLSEVLYFIDEAACARVAGAARAAAGASGIVVACDWRDTIGGRGHTGDEVHRRFEQVLDLPKSFEYVDADFVLTGWSRDTASVGTREGLKQ